MTLNGVMTVFMRYFTQFGRFGTHYVKMVGDRPTLSIAKIVALRNIGA